MHQSHQSQHHPRDSQVWDPGARILIYSENNNNNVVTNTSNNNAKEKINRINKHLKIFNTRASPNKSQDSGFSDSGESESSCTNNSDHNHNKGACIRLNKSLIF